MNDLGTQLVTRDREGYLVDRSRTMAGSSHKPLPENELTLGDFSPGRFAWELENVKALPRPLPCNGHQQLWDCSAILAAAYYDPNQTAEMKDFLSEYVEPTGGSL